MNEQLMKRRTRGVTMWTPASLSATTPDSESPARDVVALGRSGRGVRIWSSDVLLVGGGASGDVDLEPSVFEPLALEQRVAPAPPAVLDELDFARALDVVRALEVVPASYNEALDEDRFDSGDGPTEGVTSLTETLPDPIEPASQRIVIVAVTDAAPEIETPLTNADDEPPIDSPSHVQSDAPSDAIGSLQAEPAGLPAALLAAVEARLAVHVGPVARVLVARYSARQADFPELSARLADHVPSIAAREQFMRALETMHGIFETASGKSEPPANTGLQNVQSASPPDEAAPSAAPLPEQVESAAFQLARYLGPIARVIARREAAIAADLQSFHRRLAEAISNEADRAAFQRAVS